MTSVMETTLSPPFCSPRMEFWQNMSDLEELIVAPSGRLRVGAWVVLRGGPEWWLGECRGCAEGGVGVQGSVEV